MKQNYFKTICALLWLIVPMLFYPLQATAQETTLPDEAESVELAISPLNLEEVTIADVTEEATVAEAITEELPARSYTYTVYRDGEVIASGLTEPTYIDEGVDPGQHEYCVTVQYTEGESDKVCVDIEVKDFKPVTNLTGAASNDEVSLDWDGVTEKATEDKAVSYNVYKNGTKIGNTTATQYVETGVANGTYTYEVEVQYADGVSPKVAVTVTVNYTSLENVADQLPYTLRMEGKKIIAETEGTITLYDMGGRMVVKAVNRLEYTACTGAYAVHFDTGTKSHVSKVQVR